MYEDYSNQEAAHLCEATIGSMLALEAIRCGEEPQDRRFCFLSGTRIGHGPVFASLVSRRKTALLFVDTGNRLSSLHIFEKGVRLDLAKATARRTTARRVLVHCMTSLQQQIIEARCIKVIMWQMLNTV
mmetsp:Transcript_29011/g.52484  ORF Transcript_29011/g.52484 Transcript_29011/m.52484 type:complete len:129 (+) Transcript_29011:1325-1711(+)